MRRKTGSAGCLWLLGCGLAIGSPARVDGQIGVMAGYNLDMLEAFRPAEGFDLTERADGFHIGIFFNVNLGPIGIRPAVIYHQVPSLVAEAGEEQTEFDVELVEIPIDLRVRIPLPLLRPYLLAGPVFSFPSTSLVSVDPLLESTPVRAEVGAGLELRLGFRLWPEVRFGRGLGRFMRADIPIGETVLAGDGDPRLDTLTVRIGISF